MSSTSCSPPVIEPRIFDLRPSPHHDDGEVATVHRRPRRPRRRCAAAMDGCDAVVHLAASADVGSRRQEPVEAEQLQLRAARSTCSRPPAAPASTRVVYASTIWVYSDAAARASTRTPPLAPPAHLYTATKLAGELYCQLLPRALRRGLHDPALRHPLRPARPARRRDPRLRAQGARGRAADHRRRRRPDPPLRLRRGPRRRRRHARWPRSPPTASTTSSATRT